MSEWLDFFGALAGYLVVAFLVVWGFVFLLSRTAGRKTSAVAIAAGSAAFVVAGSLALLALFGFALRCDESCDSSDEGTGWENVQDAWQWDVQLMLALGGVALAGLLLGMLTRLGPTVMA